jgi:AraC-like DNA-binding protein
LILLNESVLRKYAATHNIPGQGRYKGETIMVLESDDFFRGYFNSLLPYVDSSIKKTHALSDLKICEAIELLLNHDPGLREFLFDFNAPYKLDLEKFMMTNFIFNVPVAQFASLTGRSLAAFKRDFKTVFGLAPREWLMQQRLSEAYRLIKEKGSRPADIYFEIGFENLSHFYYSFKKKYGLTPSQIG